jgi:hypothetical protein
MSHAVGNANATFVPEEGQACQLFLNSDILQVNYQDNQELQVLVTEYRMMDYGYCG